MYSVHRKYFPCVFPELVLREGRISNRQENLYNHFAMLLKDWIRNSRTKAGLTQTQLGEALGVKKANVSAWETGKHEPGFDQISRISALTGEPIPQRDRDVVGLRRVPLIDFVQAETWATMGKNMVGTSQFVTVDVKLSDRAFAVRVRGDAMYPVFMEGDYLIVDPDAQPRSNDYVVASIGEEEAVFRQYRVRGQDGSGKRHFDLYALNSSIYAPISSEGNPQVKVIGRVVRFSRDLN